MSKHHKASSWRAALLAGTAAAFAAGLALSVGMDTAAAQARVVKSGKDKVTVRITGQVTKDLIFFDDGDSSRVRIVGSNYSSSRVRWHADGKISPELNVGALIEVGVDDARNALNNTGFGGRSGNDFQTRKAELFFNHKNLGRVWLGSGDTAANGVMNTTAHGAFVFLTASSSLMLNGLQFRTSGGDGSLSGISVGTVLPDNDFASREPRIRYDTPVFQGFMASASLSDDSAAEVALRYSAKVMGTKVKAAVGYHEGSAGAEGGEIWGGALSFVHSTGLGATVAWATKDFDAAGRQDQDVFYVAGHFGRKFTEIGKTIIVGEYHQADNGGGNANQASSYGFGVLQKVDAAATEVYVKYSNFDLDRTGLNVNDIDAVMVGARIKF